MQWFVKRLANKNYTIRNVDHGLYLKPQDGYWAKEGNEVVGVIGELAAQWKVMPMDGKYWCVFYYVYL